MKKWMLVPLIGSVLYPQLCWSLPTDTSPTLPQTQQDATTRENASAAPATDVDYAIVETVALDLLKNKTYVQHFGTPRKGQPLPPRRLWVDPLTPPLFKFIVQANNADYTRTPDFPRDKFTIADDIRDSLVQRNQTPGSFAEFKPTSECVLLTPAYPLGPHPRMVNEEFSYYYPNTGWMKAWLPGFSRDGKQALLRFIIGPFPHGASGVYLLKKQGARWRIQWRYIRYSA